MITSEVLMPISIMGTFGAALYFFTKAMTDYILKKKMIDKGYVNEDTQSIFRQHEAKENKYSSLKWGLIVFFAGLSLVAMEYIPSRGDSPLPYGLFAISVSLGFLIYYYIVRKELK
ncbi:MAG: hypothetical protein JNK10_12895 [Cyclobacteriaceae bacterium]|nr:hypothetical protein [Cyclobacteriaceae bacterium]